MFLEYKTRDKQEHFIRLKNWSNLRFSLYLVGGGALIEGKFYRSLNKKNIGKILSYTRIIFSKTMGNSK